MNKKMKKNEKFENDLKYGNEGEVKFMEYINKKYIFMKTELNIIKKKEKEELTFDELEILRGWDVKITNKKTNIVKYFEVKRDQKSKYTGNIAIEYRCVKHTKSDFFIYILDAECQEMYMISTKNIKYLLSENVEGFNCYGGDGKRSYMKIIKKEELLKKSKKL